MRFQFFITTLLISCIGWSQTNSSSEAQVLQEPVKTEKYNGYGLPNTKFKKIKKLKVNFDRKDLQKPAVLKRAPQPLMPSSTQINNLNTKVEVKKPVEPFVSFGFAINPTYYIQSERQDKNVRDEILEYEINPSLKVGDFTFLGFFYYDDNIKNASANEWIDSAVVLSYKGWDLGNYFKLAPAAAVGLPLSKASREDTGLKYSLGTSLALSLNTKNMGIEKFSLAYSLGYTKMTNEFETNTKGEPVTDFRIRQRITAGYQFTDEFSFKTRFQFDSSTSKANVVRNAFLHFQVFEYAFTPNISANVGHTNAANAFLVKESEKDYYLENNVKFYDPASSYYYIGLGLSI